MIDKQLQQLSEYIKEIENTDPLDFFCTYIKKITQETTHKESDISLICNQFQSDIQQVYKKYNKKIPVDEYLIEELYQILVTLIRKQAIHSYAYQLGLEPSLYKDQMRLLFKGK